MADALEPDELARRAAYPVDRLGELVSAGVIRPLPDGRHDAGDVQRARLVGALEEAGIALGDIGAAIGAGILDFGPTDTVYGDPGPIEDVDLAGFADRLGLDEPVLRRLFVALGLPAPEAGAPLRRHDSEMLSTFVGLWRRLVADDEVLTRAARVYGDGLRRAAEGWIGLFEELVVDPIEGQLSASQMEERAIAPGRDVLDLARRMLPWLFERQLEHLTDRVNIESIERSLALAGIRPIQPTEPPAIAFADLAGYTRLTETHGDDAAAGSSATFARLAEEVAARHRGRVVKLLGDGVMLHFAAVPDALRASLDLVDAVAVSPIPSAHIGVHGGPLIHRDGDYYGRTVNIAARLSAEAGPDEVLTTVEAAEFVAASTGFRFRPRGEARLKGIDGAVPVVRVERG
jgi:adenylate cyclase